MTSLSTTAALTELQAINQMLAAVGQIPVTSIDVDANQNPTNPDVAMAMETLRQVSKEVQAEGWDFNKEYNVKITPVLNSTSKDNEIVIPTNVLQMDLCRDHWQNRGTDSVRRGGKLYNKTNHTYNWEGDQYVDIMYLFEWDDLPAAIVNYIVNRACAVFAQRVVGSTDLYTMLQGQAEQARTFALEYETQQGDYTFFGFPAGGGYYNSYQPFNALSR